MDVCVMQSWLSLKHSTDLETNARCVQLTRITAKYEERNRHSIADS